MQHPELSGADGGHKGLGGGLGAGNGHQVKLPSAASQWRSERASQFEGSANASHRGHDLLVNALGKVQQPDVSGGNDGGGGGGGSPGGGGLSGGRWGGGGEGSGHQT